MGLSIALTSPPQLPSSVPPLDLCAMLAEAWTLALVILVGLYAISSIDTIAQQQYLAMQEVRRHRQEVAAERFRSNLKAV